MRFPPMPPRPWIARLGLLALLSLMAPRTSPAQVGPQEPRAATLFTGTSLPDPPHQKTPWTAPKTRIPRFLISATTTLFEQGLADPRGCEYRSIDINTGSVWGGRGGVTTTRGWVLPAADGQAQRFAVAWSGLVYPVVKLGEPADLDADVTGKPQPTQDGRTGRMGRDSQGYGVTFESTAVDFKYPSPIKICLLLRLGRVDLAEARWDAMTGRPGRDAGQPPQGRIDLTNYGVSYVSLANDLAWFHFDRAVCALMRGDDAITLADARFLAPFQKTVEASAEELGFPKPRQLTANGDREAPFIDFLGQLPELLADAERRASEPKRPPVPPPGGDKSARVAALVRNLDQAAARQWGQPGGVSMGEAAVVQDLIAEGDDAVEPLIEVLRNDNRLTRSVSFGRDFFRGRRILGVQEAAYAALSGILNTSFFSTGAISDNVTARGKQGREEMAAQIQSYWERYKAFPLIERWYHILANERVGRAGWIQAGGSIVQPENVRIVPAASAFTNTVTTALKPGERPRLRGESLREGHDPSVTTLMQRRLDSMIKTAADSATSLEQANAMARILLAWDPPAATRSLSELARLGRRQFSTNGGSRQPAIASIAGTTVARVRAGDPDAAREYAAWLRTTEPDRESSSELSPILDPLFRLPDDPAIAEAGEWLFGDPNSPWLSLLDAGKNRSMYYTLEKATSPLLCLPSFRKRLLDLLGDRTPIGEVSVEPRNLKIKWDDGGSGGYGYNKVDPLAPKLGEKVRVRRADAFAWQLSRLEGSPAFQMYWPEPKRDEGLAAMAAHLEAWGKRFVPEDPLRNSFGRGFPRGAAHLSLPPLDHPATREDVRQKRAIFSLEGEGERRLIPLYEWPLGAKWVAYKDDPVIALTSEQITVPKVEYDQKGTVWQAEEIFQDGHWRRFYGFVGSHVIAKVPAEEIEFTEWPYGGYWRLGDGMDGLFFGPRMPESKEFRRDFAFDPGSPLKMALRLRNRSGYDREVPTEFVRKEGDRIQLRPGVELTLERAPLDGQPIEIYAPLSDDSPWEPVPAKPFGRLDAGGPTRTLRPAEPMDAFEVDLLDLFDVAKPGNYRARLTLTKESGVGDGTFHHQGFKVSNGGTNPAAPGD